MVEIAAGLNPTQYGISSYVGGTATPYQQATITISATGFPSDGFGGITAYQVSANKYLSPPTVALTSNPLPGRYVYLVGLRGNGRGNMVYARIELLAKMEFRQTCYNGWREGYWVKYYVDPPRYIRNKSGSLEQVYDWYAAFNGPYYGVLESPTTRFRVTANYQIMTVTNNSFITPGSLFAGGNTKYSSGVYDNKGGGYTPFGKYTFKAVPIPYGTLYELRGPNNAVVAYWEEKDGSFPWDDNSTQVCIGVSSDRGGNSATIDDWTAKDINTI